MILVPFRLESGALQPPESPNEPTETYLEEEEESATTDDSEEVPRVH